ncbi:D-alanine--D-alanine ligase [bacterium]|nr:D-alanine--D-alanine ligase [bacterium]
MQLLIAYNASGDGVPDTEPDPDLISEAAVLDEVNAVHQAALDLGMESRIYPVSGFYETIEEIRHASPDVIFNLCEGFRGSARFEMHMAALWELMQIPYTGNTPVTLGMTQDKVLTKRLLESKKIHTPAYQVFRSVPAKTMLEFPLIVKPSREDASLGIDTCAVVHSMTQLQQSVEKILVKYKQPVLVERYIDGREFNISLMGDPPIVMAVSEIDFTALPAAQPKITSYEAKWMPDHPMYQKTPVSCPADIPADLRERLADVSVQVYTLVGGRDYGRVDTRVDHEGRIYVLEFNANPDISPDAGFSKAVRSAGLAYRDFIGELIRTASNRK